MKTMIRSIPLALVVALTSGCVSADKISKNASGDRVYENFPVTLKGYTGSKKTSVSYSGQIARHVLHDSIKKMAGKGNGANAEELKASMLAYYLGKSEGRAIIAPRSKGPFVIDKKGIDDISKRKNLSGKTYKGKIKGMPNNMSGPELVTFWIDKAANSKKGVDLANGYNYPQLISKFIMGAVSYNQAVDNYLDEKLSLKNKPNDKPYKKGAAYTGKEHSWDEGFGYFGAPAHTMDLTAKQVYEIAKLGSKSKDPASAFKLADLNRDGKLNIKSEMAFGPAYYAAAFDKSVAGKPNATNYLHNIMRAYLDGREVITSARGMKLSSVQRTNLRENASIITTNWERVLAEAVFKYAGSAYKDMSKIQSIKDKKGDASKYIKKYFKHWGELKGFSLALQTGKNNLGETADYLNELIGFGPVLPNASQVVGINSKGNYVRDQGRSWSEYMLNMIEIQKLVIKTFGVKARLKSVI